MKRLAVLAVSALVMSLLFIGETKLTADQADCTAVFGANGTFDVPSGECRVSGAVTLSGTQTLLDDTVHLLNGAVITVGSPSLTLNITGPNHGLIMDAGSMIDGGNVTCFGATARAGFPITINADGDIDVKGPGPGGSPPGAIIRSNGCSGGAIAITTTAPHTVNIDGLVESRGTASGTGATQRPGGGPITVKAGCELSVSPTGKISSFGQDPGADLVHLEGCTVTILGLVQSTGVGHAIPNNPPNHCDGTNRPGKPSNSTACVEVWSSSTITIDSTGANKGEIDADTGGSGGSGGTSWIDLFANGNITVTGPASATFAVHANGEAGTNDIGGQITVKSVGGKVIATGQVLQTNATSPGGDGGQAIIEAALDINLNTATVLFAEGDFNASGGYGTGGTISIRSFTGNLDWQNGIGDVRPTGTGDAAHPLPPAQRGTITLTACGTVNTTGTSFPFNGTSATTPGPPTTGLCSPTAPTLPTYVGIEGTIPACSQACFPTTTTTTTTTLQESTTTTTTTSTTTTTIPEVTTTTTTTTTIPTTTTTTEPTTTTTSTSTTSTTNPELTTTTTTTSTTIPELTTTTTTVIPAAGPWGMTALGLAFVAGMAWLLRVHRALRKSAV